MSRRRFLLLLAGAALAISGALYLSAQRNLPRDSHGTPLLPTLGKELDSVTELSVRKGGAAPNVTVHRAAGQWTVAERGDYPADVAKLRKLLTALGDAKIVEEKTSNPANFPIIGVEAPDQPGAAGAEVAVLARDGKHALIVGKPSGEGNFARRSGENQSYLVEPAISVDAEPRLWIDSRLLDVPTASIQSVEIKPSAGGGAGYVLHRLKPNEAGFGPDGAPAGRTPLDSNALAPSATLLSGLTAEDVAAASGIDFSKSTQAIITLSDGGTISLTGTQAADKRWIEVQPGKDAALAAKTQGRAFEVASYRYDAIFRPLEQLLVPKESKAKAKPAVAAPKPAAGAAAGGHKPVPAPAP